jgi:AraC-like DNA-binding protein
MERDKPYLSPELTMPELARKVGISKEMLSQVINRELHLNFNAFLNRYRVEEAKRKLKDPRENQFVILKIALDVGFNSKSSFNAVFKKTTGMSPSDYRKRYQEK